MEQDDLDEFLYGEDSNAAPSATAAAGSTAESSDQPASLLSATPAAVPPPGTTKVSATGVEGDAASEASSEDEDDLEIVLDDTGNDIEDSATAAGKPSEKRGAMQLKPTGEGEEGGAGQDSAGNKMDGTAMDEVMPLKNHININGIGEVDGRSILEIDLDMIEDKPWRKPGADITDYFNYGFNENTWRAYCIKQKQMREEAGLQYKNDFNMMMVPDINNLPYGSSGGYQQQQQQQQQHSSGGYNDQRRDSREYRSSRRRSRSPSNTRSSRRYSPDRRGSGGGRDRDHSPRGDRRGGGYRGRR